MSPLHVRIACLALVLLLLAPSMAAACPIPFRRIGPITVRTAELREPRYRTSTLAAWKLDASWTASRPQLNQELVVRRIGVVEGVSYPRQRALSVDAVADLDYGWRYTDDRDERTPPCVIAGQGDWQPPVIMLREDARRIRIAAVARRTEGSRSGCWFGIDQERGCPAMTRRVLRLKAPVGTRTIEFELPA
jgi:hypothetical protein